MHSIQQNHLFNSWFWIRQNLSEMKYHKYWLFPFFLVQTNETVFRWIIVQDDEIQFQFLPVFIHMNLFFFKWKGRDKVCFGQFVVNEVYSCIVCVYFLYCDTEKNITTVGTITLRFWLQKIQSKQQWTLY